MHNGALLRRYRKGSPYEGMNITGGKGLDEAAIATLKAIGAVEDIGRAS
jgi:hypothetical protein